MWKLVKFSNAEKPWQNNYINSNFLSIQLLHVTCFFKKARCVILYQILFFSCTPMRKMERREQKSQHNSPQKQMLLLKMFFHYKQLSIKRVFREKQKQKKKLVDQLWFTAMGSTNKLKGANSTLTPKVCTW